jgi:hypothetical protein
MIGRFSSKLSFGRHFELNFWQHFFLFFFWSLFFKKKMPKKRRIEYGRHLEFLRKNFLHKS